MQNGIDTDISAGARKAMDAFMYQTQTAVDNMENAGIQSEIVAAKGAFNIGTFLRGVTHELNVHLQNLENEVHGSTKQIEEANAKYEMFLQKSQNAEQVINSGLEQKQGMTGQLAKEQQNMIQFAQIIDTVNSYLGNLISGPLVN